MQQLILVNEQDVPTGSGEKMETHEKGWLHRAFSVFIFNSKGDMLLQQRAISKYHSGGLWTNACCSHPLVGEETQPAAEKRLMEEMGFTVPLTKVFEFTYKASFDNGLTEFEFDHVFTGTYDGLIQPNPDEVQDYCFIPMEKIQESIDRFPERYTEWFKLALPKLADSLKANS